jgi:hypothetical protein
MDRKLIFALVATLAVVGLAACGGDDDSSDGNPSANQGTATAQDRTDAYGESDKPSPGDEPRTIVVRNAEPVGGVAELEYSAGDEVAFRVRSDVADEVHVHGYDLSKRVPAEGTVAFSFTADLEGIFEIELEERAVQIAELRVNP